MICDILILDTICSKAYNHETIEEDAIGGTEASTIRLAEGFGSKGLNVIVALHKDILPTTSPNRVRYVPLRWITKIQPPNVIHLRSRQYFDSFPKSQNFGWLHDACYKQANNISDWDLYTKPNNVKLICVSDWHKVNIESLNPRLNVTRIYSPVDELCYTHKRPDSVNLNQMVWMSSPHKGLHDALKVFKELRDVNPKFKLVVFNPGYFDHPIDKMEGVVLAPKYSRAEMRLIVAHSLCLFYPTQFEETFGLVAAEANALGTPVACYPVAALRESCGNQFAQDKDGLKEMILKWQANRPVICGQERFRFSNVFNDWQKLLRL